VSGPAPQLKIDAALSIKVAMHYLSTHGKSQEYYRSSKEYGNRLHKGFGSYTPEETGEREA